MNTIYRFAALAALAAGVRISNDDAALGFVSDDDAALGFIEHADEPPKDESQTKKLNQWFKDNTLPSGDQEKMDGSVDDPVWAYMKSKCFQSRYVRAALLMLRQKCDTAIEVGGYLTPLDQFLLKVHKKKGGHLPSKYINIDPSMKDGKVAVSKTGNETDMTSYHLPMTLADFFDNSTESLRKDNGLSLDSSCVIIFGIWDPHFKTDADKAAMKTLMEGVKFAGVETSDYAKDPWLDRASKVCTDAGLSNIVEVDADCREALKGEGKKDSTTLRHMKFFVKKSEAKKHHEKDEDSDSMVAMDRAQEGF